MGRTRVFAQALALLPLLVVGLAVAASAQSLPTTQITGFICKIVQSLQAMAPFIVMLAIAAGLAMALVARKGSLVADLIIAMIIALGLINLGAILGAFGISAC